jgi:hypothetical protein
MGAVLATGRASAVEQRRRGGHDAPDPRRGPRQGALDQIPLRSSAHAGESYLARAVALPAGGLGWRRRCGA